MLRTLTSAPRAERAADPRPLAELYAPVAAELQHVARILHDELVSDEPRIDELCRYVEHYHGKQLRPALLLLAGQACGPLRPAHRVLAAVVELVHLATLVHDDVLDDGNLRRRAATVNRMWGNEQALLLGDILFSHAYRLCSTLDSQDAAETIAQTAITVCEGEMLQIAHRGDYDLSEETYLNIITRKTAALTGTCTRLGAQFAGADEHTCARVQEFGVCLGIAFQIIDDLLDLTGDEAIAGKSLYRDVQKGEPTLPLIHFLRASAPPARTEMLALLPRDDAGRCGRITALLEATRSVAYARHAAQDYIRRAGDLLATLPPSDARQSLYRLGEFVLTRGC